MTKTHEKRAEQAAQLEAAVREVFAEDGFRQWAETRRSFHDYSWSNQFMIAMQAPNASRVAGYKAWQKLGRQVRKGEHAIRIWAPRMAKVEDDSGKEDRRCIGFFLVPVFDIAQTEGDELPTFPGRELETADYPAALNRLEAFTRGELGFELTYEDSLGGAHGVCDINGKTIAVEARLSTDARLKTLAHEVAHAHGIGYREYGRERAEVIVEAAAALALATLGLDSSSYSVAYIAAYGEDGGIDALKKDLGAIDRIASALEDAMVA